MLFVSTLFCVFQHCVWWRSVVEGDAFGRLFYMAAGRYHPSRCSRDHHAGILTKQAQPASRRPGEVLCLNLVAPDTRRRRGGHPQPPNKQTCARLKVYSMHLGA